MDAKKIYDLKLEIIQRNLYGVDIDEFAVNIAMLRMWLSLAIDYEGQEAGAPTQPGFQGGLRRQPVRDPDPKHRYAEVQGTLGRDVEKIQRLGQLKAELHAGIHRRADKTRFKEGYRGTDSK